MADICGVLLAAGYSTRYRGNKLLADIGGRPLINYSASALAPCDRIIAVVRADDKTSMAVLNTLGVDCVFNDEAGRGMGHSIACAIHASPDSGGWCLLPADMPYVKAATTQRLISALHDGSDLAAPFYNEHRGHPVAFSNQFRDVLAGLDGDCGARSIIEHHVNQLTVVDCDDAGVLIDIDTVEELEQQTTVKR